MFSAQAMILHISTWKEGNLQRTTCSFGTWRAALRKVTKSKSVFPTDDSLLKMLYLAMMDITKKWTGRRQDWSRIHAQLSIYFAERMPD